MKGKLAIFQLLLYLTLPVLLIACSSEGQKEISKKKADNTDTLEGNRTGVDSIVLRGDTWLGDPINMRELKELKFLNITSGVLPQSESNTLCKSSDHKFFGHYQLMNKSDSKSGFIGQLVVSVSCNAENWTYNNDSESFVELRLENKGIKIWQEIGVGTTEIELNSFLGSNFHYKKGTMIIAEINDCTLNATILGDTINSLTVGKYCK